jgi:hypothetical protein
MKTGALDVFLEEEQHAFNFIWRFVFWVAFRFWTLLHFLVACVCVAIRSGKVGFGGVFFCR